MKDDVSSSESSYPRTPSPDIELGELFKFEKGVQIDPGPKQLKMRHEVDDESDEVDTEHPHSLNLEMTEDSYQNYLNTRQRITAIEGQFRAYNNLDLLYPGSAPALAEARYGHKLQILAENLYTYRCIPLIKV